MIGYETFSPNSIASFVKIILGPLTTLLSKYLTLSGKGPNQYNISRPRMTLDNNGNDQRFHSPVSFSGSA
jgi:hypothetical protein